MLTVAACLHSMAEPCWVLLAAGFETVHDEDNELVKADGQWRLGGEARHPMTRRSKAGDAPKMCNAARAKPVS